MEGEEEGEIGWENEEGFLVEGGKLLLAGK